MDKGQDLNTMEPLPVAAGKSALVIGASMAGLLTARVLSKQFDQVTILEKDPIQDRPESRPGQPQTRHAHGLLTQGLHILEAFFPGLTAELIADGATAADLGEAIRWHQYGGYRQQYTSGLKGITVSRSLLEWKIRRRVMDLPNVDFRAGVKVERLIPNSGFSRITGLQVRDSQDGNSKRGLVADFFIDASGRGTRTPRWLIEIGYPPPTKEEVRVDIGYMSRIYRRRNDDRLAGKIAMILPRTPDDKRMAYLLPIENDRWILEIGGWHGQPLPKDDPSVIGFLRDLSAPDIFHVLKDAQPLTDIVFHKFPTSRRLRYEQLTRFPEGYLVIGDALASFNPVYGQGMTSVAMQAAALDTLLKDGNGLEGLWRPYFKEMALVVDAIWQLAVSEDFRFPETRGKKPFATDLLNWYLGRVHKATQRDTIVYGQFLQVMNLLAPASSLMHPRILLRIIKDMLSRGDHGAACEPRQVKSIYASART